MLGGAGMKKLFSGKILDGADIKNLLKLNTQARLTRKCCFAENARQGMYNKSPLTQNIRWGWHEKSLSTKNSRGDWYKKSLFYTSLP